MNGWGLVWVMGREMGNEREGIEGGKNLKMLPLNMNAE
jgi:hypothetical protein